jgi:hypothetical protein
MSKLYSSIRDNYPVYRLLTNEQTIKKERSMLPPKSDPKWITLIKGNINTSFKSVSGNMLLTRLSRSLEKDSSVTNVAICLDEAYTFFTKFEHVFSAELEQLFK